MCARRWVEFGKMFNNIVTQSDFEIMVESWDRPAGIRYTAQLSTANDCFESDEHVSPYLALKQVYFRDFLGQTATEDIALDFSDDQLEDLYVLADKDGVTIDEKICELLTNYIENQVEIEQGECCYNCVYLNEGEHFGATSRCEKLNRQVKYENSCSGFYPR